MQMMPQHPPDGIRRLALPNTGTSRARVLLDKCAVCHIDRLGFGRVAVTIEARIAFERDRVGDQLRTDRATCRVVLLLPFTKCMAAATLRPVLVIWVLVADEPATVDEANSAAADEAAASAAPCIARFV